MFCQSRSGECISDAPALIYGSACVPLFSLSTGLAASSSQPQRLSTHHHRWCPDAPYPLGVLCPGRSPVLLSKFPNACCSFLRSLTSTHTAQAGAVDILHPRILILYSLVDVGVGCTSCHDGQTLLYIRQHSWRRAGSPQPSPALARGPANLCPRISSTA